MNKTSNKCKMGVCPGCKLEIEKTEENKIIGKNNYTRYWHKDCWENYQKEKERKKAEELSRKAIFNYLVGLGMTPNYAFWGRQRNKFINEQGYTDSGILIALKYWFEEKNNSIEKSNGGMGIVPYIYDEAQKYYQNIILKKKKLENEAVRQQNENKTIIKIKKQKQNKNKDFIDLESITGGD